ncbi:GntR family transcriptional regulator [Aquibacillus rhizosphaerae]|uniref:GntR family transcriptional regulator n=1 Tax=Aquibacillus rhizosphaerae TaxID=3051431 RepID=A0ABT7LAA0_9BACI|nr:GntR family transcriptional regulator [Aquibacillus sp. LR5S19]MDL4842777.1 GntR family transcriptional regulator [Aquibacillus sp. LR5S19]
MIINSDGTKPIYVQIAEWLETEILNGNIQADEKMYSQYQLADIFNINPATAAKGISILANEAILYKKRGLGTFVSIDAKQIILTKRKDQTLKKLVKDLVVEAEHLNVSESELIQLIKDAGKNDEGDEE